MPATTTSTQQGANKAPGGAAASNAKPVAGAAGTPASAPTAPNQKEEVAYISDIYSILQQRGSDGRHDKDTDEKDQERKHSREPEGKYGKDSEGKYSRESEGRYSSKDVEGRHRDRAHSPTDDRKGSWRGRERDRHRDGGDDRHNSRHDSSYDDDGWRGSSRRRRDSNSDVPSTSAGSRQEKHVAMMVSMHCRLSFVPNVCVCIYIYLYIYIYIYIYCMYV
jgi:hypothetical protein